MRASNRYAKALLDLAKEKGVLEAVMADVTFLLSVEKESSEFRMLLKSPVIKPLQKIEAFRNAFADQVSPLTVLFVNQVIKHGREAHLVHILEK